MPFGMVCRAEDPDGGVVRDAALDREAEALLEELARSQQEVHLLMTQQREHATELGGMKEHLSTEVGGLCSPPYLHP